MKIPLNLSKEKREIFMEYFHAAFRKIPGNYFTPSGQANFLSDGRYQISLSFELQTSSGIANLIWTLVIEVDGSLQNIEVDSNEIAEEIWSAAATKFVTEVLSSAFSGNSTRFFHRTSICRIGEDLHGEYWLPGFRFAPSMQEDEKSYWMDAERYLYIDQEVDAIDNIHANDIAYERALNFTARLSLILDISLYQPSSTKRWIILKDASENYFSKLEPLGFIPRERAFKMPQKGVECRAGKFDGSILDEYLNAGGGTLLMCPIETRKILRGVANCAPNIQDAFDSCARLYQASLVAGKGYPTIRLAYQVGAIESITQKVDGYKGFSDFVRKEAQYTDNKFLDYLYSSVRSAHLHGGAFPLGEYSSQKRSLGLSNLESFQNHNNDWTASTIMRRSIMSWILREIVPMAGDS